MKNQKNKLLAPRRGCKDIWNAEKLKDAHFGKYDIVDCPTTAHAIPSKLITYEEVENDDGEIEKVVNESITLLPREYCSFYVQ